ncbi:hypothetical protein RB595_007863 [Gaeumannomyces hyphopodioides]
MAGASVVCRLCRPRPPSLWSSYVGPRCRLEAHVRSQTGLPGERSASSAAAPPAHRPPSSAVARAKTGARGASPAAVRARRAAARAKSKRPAKPPDDGLEEVTLGDFKLSHIEPSPTPVTIDDGHMLLCSFNAVVDQGRWYTVISPGDAPVWRPPLQYPVNIRPRREHLIKHHGSGLPYNDALYKRMQTFTAVEAMRPDFLFDDVDIVIEARVLERIFSYCYGEDMEGREEETGSPDLRLDMALAGEKTLFVERPRPSSEALRKFFRTVTRRVPDLEASNDPDNPQVYKQLREVLGTAFEEYLTRKPLRHQSLKERLSSHQRFLLYRLGHLKVVVETGVDARFEKPLTTRLNDFGERDYRHYEMSTAEPGSWLQHQTFPYVARVEMSGRPFPHSQALELKINGRLRGTDQTSLYRHHIVQCWFSRVSHLAYGMVPRGGWTLNEVRMIQMDDACRKLEKGTRAQMALRRVAMLLDHWRNLVRNASKSATQEHHRAASAIIDGRNYADPNIRVVFPRYQPTISFSDDFLKRWWVSQRPGGSEFRRREQAILEYGGSEKRAGVVRRLLRWNQPEGAFAKQREEGSGAAPESEPEVTIDNLPHAEDGHRPGEGWALRHRQPKSPVEEKAARQKTHVRAAAEEKGAQQETPIRVAAGDKVARQEMRVQAVTKSSNNIPTQEAHPPFKTKSWVTVQSEEDFPPSYNSSRRLEKGVVGVKEDSGTPTVSPNIDSTTSGDAIPRSARGAETASASPSSQDLSKKGREPLKTAQEISSRARAPTTEESKPLAMTESGSDEHDERVKKLAQLLQASKVGTIKSTKVAKARVPGSMEPKVEGNTAKKVEEKAEARVEEKGETKTGKVKVQAKEKIKVQTEKVEVQAKEKAEIQTEKVEVQTKTVEVTTKKVEAQTKEKVAAQIGEKVEVQTKKVEVQTKKVEVQIREKTAGHTKDKAEVQTDEKIEAQAKDKAEKKARETTQAKRQAKPATPAAESFTPGVKRRPKPPQNPEPGPNTPKPPAVPPKSSTGTYFIPTDLDWP